MVGIDKEEHLHTHFLTSLKYRHPWLQLNLMTAFLAAFVVGMFEDTISRIVMLAVFLPVLAGQSGNTGSQSLAITLRGITLGEMTEGMFRKVAMKEIYLGLANGFLVGITASIAMYVYATWSHSPVASSLALIVLLAMVGSCVISGLTGVLVPLGLKKLGADPTTASAIFLTTATDVVSMGMFLGFATVMVL
jgi:magnesium transporter